MKTKKQRINLLTFCLFMIINIQYSFAQEKAPLDPIENSSNPSIKKGEYSKGMKQFNTEFMSKFIQPQNITEKQVSTIIQFTIEVDGTVSEFEILKYDKYGIGLQAIEIIKNMSAWIPAEQNGQKVKSRFTIPLTINVEKNKN